MKQKIVDYIEELERKSQDSERYFKLWHKEYHKNKQALEYIEDYLCSYDYTSAELKEISDIFVRLMTTLRGEDSE